MAESGEYLSIALAPHDQLEPSAIVRINPQGERQRVRP